MLSIVDLSLKHGARVLFDHVSLRVKKGCRYGLVGANGAGKTTFLKVISGEIEPSGGQLVYHEGANIGALKQDYYLYEDDTLMDVVLRGKPRFWKAYQKKNQLLEIEDLTEAQLYELADLEAIIAEEEGYVAESEAGKLLEGLGFNEKLHQSQLKAFSGGYKMRVMLCQLLFGKPRLLLLDEPTNYLDILSISWLEVYLKSFEGTILVSSHDRYFLNEVSTDILDIDYATITPYKGNYESFLLQKQAILEEKEKTVGQLDKKQKHLNEFIERFGAKASKASQAQSKAKAVAKLEEEKQSVNISKSTRAAPSFRFVMGSRPPAVFVKAEGIFKAFGEKRVLHDVSFDVQKGDKLAIVGPNGIGKSTLLEILMQRLKSDSGKVDWSMQAEVVYFPQYFEKEFSPEMTPIEWIDHVSEETNIQKIRGALGACLFKEADLNKKIQMLSGGEKARLYMAKLMLMKHNMMILDEPTNHLDLESCEALVEVLKAYEGGVMIVSHDRYFISHLATRILELSLEGTYDFKGDYSEYLAKRERDFLSKNAKDHQVGLSNVEQSKIVPKVKVDQNQKRELKKAVDELEKTCQKKEMELEKVLSQISSEEFYIKTSEQEKQQVFKTKSKLETELEHNYQLWESKTKELDSF